MAQKGKKAAQYAGGGKNTVSEWKKLQQSRRKLRVAVDVFFSFAAGLKRCYILLLSNDLFFLSLPQLLSWRTRRGCGNRRRSSGQCGRRRSRRSRCGEPDDALLPSYGSQRYESHRGRCGASCGCLRSSARSNIGRATTVGIAHLLPAIAFPTIGFTATTTATAAAATPPTTTAIRHIRSAATDKPCEATSTTTVIRAGRKSSSYHRDDK